MNINTTISNNNINNNTIVPLNKIQFTVKCDHWGAVLNSVYMQTEWLHNQQVAFRCGSVL